MTTEGWLTYLEKIPKRAIYILLMVVLVLPVFNPWGLPIAISSETEIMYERLNELDGTGKTILIIPIMRPTFWGEHKHLSFAVVQHWCLLDDVKLIVAPIASVYNIALYAEIFDMADLRGKTYGKDWVVLSFSPGGVPVNLARIRDNFRGTFKADQYGTPVDQLEAMDGINSLGDFSVVIFQEQAKNQGQVARVLYPAFSPESSPPYDITYFTLCGAGGFMFIAPYLGVGNVYTSGLWGTRRAAEYQILYGGPYSGAVTQMDALSAYHLVAVLLYILGNIPTVARLLRKGGVK